MLLNIDANPKTVKGQAKGFMTAVLYLAPWKLSGYNVCPMAETAMCHLACLNTAGQGGMWAKTDERLTVDGMTIGLNNVQRARIRRTRMFMEQREAFFVQLVKEIAAFITKAERKGLTPVVRLNGTSDIAWENIVVSDNKNIFQLFPDIQFYDYTKIPTRKNLPSNYHLTFSYSGIPQYAGVVQKAVANNMNMAVVFGGVRTKHYHRDADALPETFMGFRVIDGDEHDLRFLDDSTVVVGLRAKGAAKKDTTGFVVQVK